jgi:hypothetical protein
MANKKVSQLTSKPSVLVTDLFPIADPSTGQLYKTTISDLGTAIGSGVSSVNGLVGAVVLDTDDIQELVSPTNKWFTDTRARAALSASSPLAYNSGTGVFSIPAATSSQNGYLTSTDWTTFNAKQAALSGTGFVKISGTTISYDNTSYLPLTGGTVTGGVTFSSTTAHTGTATFGVGSPTAIDGSDGRIITNKFRLYNTTPATIYSDFVTSATTNRTITIPDATGTMALTSDLSSYLPLSGGTLTGALSGTSGNFSSFVQSSNFFSDGTQFYSYGLKGRASDNYGAIGFYSNNGATRYGYIQSGSIYGGQINITGDGGGYMTFDNRGITATGAASFSSTVNVNQLSINTTATNYKLHVVTTAVAGRQDMTNINRTSANMIRFTNPQYSTLASMGILLRVFPDSDARQGAGIIASGGSLNGETDLDLFVSKDLTTSNSYSALSIKGGNGSVGIGTTSTSGKLHIINTSGTGQPVLELHQQNSGSNIVQWKGSGGSYLGVISDSGSLGVGTTSPGYQFESAANTTNFAAMIRNNTSTFGNGLYLYFPNSSSSSTNEGFLRAENSAGVKAYIYTNGSFGSATGTYGALASDIRLKENVLDASSKLEDLLKLRVVNFNLIEDTDKRKQIGFIAQEFKEIFPSLVYERDTREYDENGNVIKGLKDSLGLSVGMEFAILTKAIQELNYKIEQLKNK